jgi:pimeloyl-ACP methyl ester carboxylesterase
MNTTPLVLLHGYPFDHTMWDKVTARLTCDVIAPDLRGFGGTSPGDDEPSLDLMADDLARLLDQRKIVRAIVAGFSMGGYAALSFAERYPQTLAGLGLINSQALPDSEQTRTARRAMVEKVRREGPRVALEAALPKLFSPANATNTELIRFPSQAAERAGVTGITWALEAMARRPDRSGVLEKLSRPLLLIHSTGDQFIPIEQAHALAERMPKALSVEISGAGHCSPLETPELVSKALSELVTRVEAASIS